MDKRSQRVTEIEIKKTMRKGERQTTREREGGNTKQIDRKKDRWIETMREKQKRIDKQIKR